MKRLINILRLVPLFLLISCSGYTDSTTVIDTEPTITTPQPITMTDGLGRQVSLNAPAQRIISLAPSNTEILFAIGAGSRLIGRDSFSDYPDEAQQIQIIGGDLGEIDAETILALQPDLVLASSLTAPEQIQTLEDLGLTVFTVTNPEDISGLFPNIKTVAELTGQTEAAILLIDQLQARVNAVEVKINQISYRPLVYYELDGTDPNAPWTPGPGNFIDKLISMAGGDNLGNVLSNEWAQISIETIIAQDPEIILLGNAHWGGVTPEEVAARTGWDTLSAIKEGKIYPFDDNLVSRPGPRLVDGLETMAKLLHPELFP